MVSKQVKFCQKAESVFASHKKMRWPGSRVGRVGRTNGYKWQGCFGGCERWESKLDRMDQNPILTDIMRKILFVCEYNACRSQMAEGLARHLRLENVSVQSAGLYPGKVNTLTIEVMREIGIDISSHQSKLLEVVEGDSFDYLIVLAEPAVQPTRYLDADHRLEWFYPDPAKTEGSPEMVRAAIRRVRDALKAQIGGFFLK